MRTRSIQLTEHFDSFVESGVQAGRFRDASEVIGEGLRLLEQREAEDRIKLEALRAAAADGFSSLDRGEGTAFHSMDDLEGYIHRSAEDLVVER